MENENKIRKALEASEAGTLATEPASADTAYESPVLRELGTLLDLTQSGRGTNLERFLGSH